MNTPTGSLRRIATRAAWFVVPAVALALGAPVVVKRLRSPSELMARLQREAAPPGGAAEQEPARPPPPEGPTPEQIEGAREAQVALGKAQRGWESVTLIAPRDARRGEDGLETRPFQGFGVEVESEPAGARVLAGGADLGETPLLASVPCTVGSDVAVRVEKAPLRPWERTVRCRADTLVRLRARLGGR